jgi:hypothetical protein
LGEEDELGTMVLLAQEAGGGAVEIGGVARADMGGVGTEEEVVVTEELAMEDVEILVGFGLPPLDLGRGDVGSDTAPGPGWFIPLAI